MKILLVDDSKSARYALRLQLQRHGIEVDTADSAESAFEVLKGPLPDVIFMDHMMPGLNGFEAFEVIHAEPRTAHIPVVMCTSQEEAEFVAAARKKGVFGILPKSSAPERLPAILAELKQALQGQEATAPAQTSAPAAPAATVETTPSAAPEHRPAASAPGKDKLSQEISTLVQAYVKRALPALADKLRRDLTEALQSEFRSSQSGNVEELRRDLTEGLLAEVESRQEANLDSLRQTLTDDLRTEVHTTQTALIKDLRRDLVRRLRAEIHSAQRAANPALTVEDFQTRSKEMISTTLPNLIRLEIEAERGRMIELIEAHQPHTSDVSSIVELAVRDRMNAVESAAAKHAVVMTRRETHESIEAALQPIQEDIESLSQSLEATTTRLQILILVAALVGLAAAGIVFFLLQ